MRYGTCVLNTTGYYQVHTVYVGIFTRAVHAWYCAASRILVTDQGIASLPWERVSILVLAASSSAVRYAHIRFACSGVMPPALSCPAYLSSFLYLSFCFHPRDFYPKTCCHAFPALLAFAVMARTHSHLRSRSRGDDFASKIVQSNLVGRPKPFRNLHRT